MFSEDGFKLPSLCTYYKKRNESMTKEEKEQDRDLTDAELMERDVIKVFAVKSKKILHCIFKEIRRVLFNKINC